MAKIHNFILRSAALFVIVGAFTLLLQYNLLAPKTIHVTSARAAELSTPIFGGFSSDDGRYFKYSHVFPLPHQRKHLNFNPVVCLASQSSVNRLDSLPWLLESWKGPISLAVFAPRRELMAFAIIVNYLRSCYSNAIDSRVSFHIVQPRNDAPIDLAMFDNDEVASLGISCARPDHAIKELVKLLGIEQSDSQVAYPHNVLRNFARYGCRQPHSVVTDLDMIPAMFSFERLDKFLKGTPSCNNCVYVMPVYEVENNEICLPLTKASLMNFVENKRAQRYHLLDSVKGEYSTNMTRWEMSTKKSSSGEQKSEECWTISSSSSTTTQMENSTTPYSILYEITDFYEGYEPIMVMNYSAPGWDERFEGFGKNRNSQSYELMVANYTFNVLDDAFLIHRGVANNYPLPEYKRHMLEINNAKFAIFTEELAAKYQFKIKPHRPIKEKVQQFFRRTYTIKGTENTKPER